MILDLIVASTTIASGAAATGTVVLFDAAKSPMKIVRFYGTMGLYSGGASGRVTVFADTGEVIYQSSDIAPSGSFNIPTDVDVFPGYSVALTTVADIGAGNTGVTTIKIQLEK